MNFSGVNLVQIKSDSDCDICQKVIRSGRAGGVARGGGAGVGSSARLGPVFNLKHFETVTRP